MRSLIFCAILVGLVACGKSEKRGSKDRKLPVLGRKHVEQVKIEGGMKADTVYHKIQDFKLVDQDSNIVTPATFDGQVYVADFFFTTCPTICPKMKAQMLRVYEAFKTHEEVALLSHTIDPEYDTVALLKEYANNLGVDGDKWHFVTGEKEKIYELGKKSYMVTADEDPNAPGGFIHSGAFILVDKQRRIRGIYDGTVPAEVDELIDDINILLDEG